MFQGQVFPTRRQPSRSDAPARERFRLIPLTQIALDEAVAGAFAPFSGILRLGPDPAARTLPELARSGALADALAAFADAHPGGERRAAASLWSAYLFADLIVPTLAAGARLGLALPLERAALRLEKATGLPASLHLPSEPGASSALPLQVERLLAGSVAPAIALLRAETGLSARLLWENAGGHLFWILDAIARDMPERAGEAREALRSLRWPREACAALTLMRADAMAGRAPPRRRVCCLRHALPGFSRCAGICPLGRGDGGPPPREKVFP